MCKTFTASPQIFEGCKTVCNLDRNGWKFNKGNKNPTELFPLPAVY